MCFDDDPFGVVGGEAAEETLTRQMRGLEKRHFSNVTPTDRLEVKNLDGPAELLCIGKERVLRINPAVASYPHLFSVLILHELINNKLLSEGRAIVSGRPLYEIDKSAYEALVQPEVDRLWRDGAYTGLL
jgi:hypothetical protein